MVIARFFTGTYPISRQGVREIATQSSTSGAATSGPRSDPASMKRNASVPSGPNPRNLGARSPDAFFPDAVGCGAVVAMGGASFHHVEAQTEGKRGRTLRS